MNLNSEQAASYAPVGKNDQITWVAHLVKDNHEYTNLPSLTMQNPFYFSLAVQTEKKR